MPEINIGIYRVNKAEQRGRHKRYQLKIRHHIEQTYEKTQQDSHRKAYDTESYAEHNAHDEGHQSLSAKIMVHRIFDIVADAECDIAVLRRHHTAHPAQQALVVQHYEHHVQHHYEPVEYP